MAVFASRALLRYRAVTRVLFGAAMLVVHQTARHPSTWPAHGGDGDTVVSPDIGDAREDSAGEHRRLGHHGLRLPPVLRQRQLGRLESHPEQCEPDEIPSSRGLTVVTSYTPFQVRANNNHTIG